MGKYGRKNLTPEAFKKIWKLHKCGMKTKEIAEFMEISQNTVSRTIDAFKLAESGNIEELTKFKTGHKSTYRFAVDYFGLKPDETAPDAPQIAPDALPVVPDNTAEYLIQLLTETKRTNELLERLCEAWRA